MTPVVFDAPSHLLQPRDRTLQVSATRLEKIAARFRRGDSIQALVVSPTQVALGSGRVNGWEIIEGGERYMAQLALMNVRVFPCVLTDRSDLFEPFARATRLAARRKKSVMRRMAALLERHEIYQEFHKEIGKYNRLRDEMFIGDTVDVLAVVHETLRTSFHCAQTLEPWLRALEGTKVDNDIEARRLATWPRADIDEYVERLLHSHDACPPPTRIEPRGVAAQGVGRAASANHKKLSRLLRSWGRCPQHVRDMFLAEIGAPLSAPSKAAE